MPATPSPATPPGPSPPPAMPPVNITGKTVCNAPLSLVGCSPSNLGYSCSKTVGDDTATIHWSAGNCPAPSNPCTHVYKLADGETQPDANTTELVHVAVVQPLPTSGAYLAVAFPQNANKMFPADAVIGQLDSTGVTQTRTFKLEAKSSAGVKLVTAAEDWAVLKGTVSSGGAITMCFTRPAHSTKAPYIKHLNLGSVGLYGRRLQQAVPITNMIWAFGPTAGNLPSYHNTRGGATVQLAMAVAADGPAPPPAPPAPVVIQSPPPPLAGRPTTCPTAIKIPTCTSSDLGYSCSTTDVSGFNVHYSVGGCYPDNVCTRAYSIANGGSMPDFTTTEYLHMAVEAATGGYVGVAFGKTRGEMAPADSIIGWVTDVGSGNIGTYYITDESVSTGDLVTGAQDWAPLKGVAQLQGPRTIVCFSRPLSTTLSKIAPNINTTEGIVMNFASSPSDRLTQHNVVRSATVNLATGKASTTITKAVLVHAILMCIAFAGLFPLGVLGARHKWAVQDMRVFGNAVWFHFHRAVQVTATGAFIAAIAIAWAKLEVPDTALGKAHEALGIAIFILAMLQVLGAFIRPHPGEKWRPEWNLFHWWNGRLTIALAVANVYIGIVLWDRTELKAEGKHRARAFFIGVTVVLGTWVILDLLLSGLRLLGYGKKDDSRVSSTYLPTATVPGLKQDDTIHANQQLKDAPTYDIRTNHAV